MGGLESFSVYKRTELIESMIENKMNIREEIESGSKILIVRDAVPVGKIGIDIILDNGEIHKGVIDIRAHRELLMTLMESLDDPLEVTA